MGIKIEVEALAGPYVSRSLRLLEFFENRHMNVARL
jgi:hypothetical protein